MRQTKAKAGESLCGPLFWTDSEPLARDWLPHVPLKILPLLAPHYHTDIGTKNLELE